MNDVENKNQTAWDTWKLMSLRFNIPEGRISDKHWLLRNFGIRNSDHPDFETALGAIKNMEVPRSIKS